MSMLNKGSDLETVDEAFAGQRSSKNIRFLDRLNERQKRMEQKYGYKSSIVEPKTLTKPGPR
jgi:hypothetical protein